MITHKLSLRLALFISMMTSSYAQALDLNAGDYDPAPAGTTIFNLYLQNGLSNNLYSHGSAVPGRNRLHTEIGILSLERYIDINGMLAVPLILLPFGHVSGTVAGNSLGSDNGLGYPILGMPVWLINNPQKQTYLAISPFLYLPAGSYSSQRAVNLGENRYWGTLQVAFSTHLTPKIAWDIAADTTVYGDNRDAVGGGTLSQKIGYQVQTNARYFIYPWADVRAGVSYMDAGDTKQNGVTTEAFTESKFWLGTGLWASNKTEIIATYGRDIAVKNSFKDTNQINLKLVYVF